MVSKATKMLTDQAVASSGSTAATNAAGTSAPVAQAGAWVTFQATGLTTNGAGAATILAQVSNDGVHWLTLATFSLTLGTTVGADAATGNDGFACAADWKYWRANLTAISGTGAKVSVTMGS